MHKCPLCEKEYERPQHMVQHLQRVHNYNNEQLQDLYDKMYLNGVRPKCKFHGCDNDAIFTSFIKGYKDCCCRGHATAYSVYKKTGSWSTLHTKEGEEKVKKAFEKFEGGQPLKDTKVRDKGTQTLIERYGVEHAMHSDSIKEKFFKTNEEKYHGRSPMCSKEVQSKRKETILKNNTK